MENGLSIVTSVAPTKIAEPKDKKPTTEITLEMYQQGMSIEDIAENRFLTPTTIASHLCQLYEKGENLDIYNFISNEELMTISQAFDIFEEPYKLREIFEYFSEAFSFEKIRWALAFHNKKKLVEG